MWSLLLFCLCAFFCNLASATVNTQVVAQRNGQEKLLEAHSLSDFSFLDKAKTELAEFQQNWQSLPTCERLATGALITDCKSLARPVSQDPNNLAPGADAEIRDQQQLYAARLSVCELNNTGNPIPKQCRPLLPTVRNTKQKWLTGVLGKPESQKTSYPDYERDSANAAPECIKALYDSGNGQAWTTYSSNRASMAYTCHALRVEIERDEQVEFMTGTAKAYQSMFAAAADSLETFINDQTEREQALRASYADLLARQNDFDAEFGRSIANILAKSSDVQDVLTELNDLARSFQRRSEDVANKHQEQMNELAVSGRSKQEQAYADNLALFNQAQAYQMASLSQSIVQVAGQIEQNMTQAIDRTREKIDDLGDQAMELHDVVKTTKENAKSLNDLFGPIISLATMLENVLPKLPVLATHTGGTIFFALLSFGFWQKIVTMSMLGHTSLSLATGWMLSSVWTSSSQSLDLAWSTINIPDCSTLAIIPTAGYVVVSVVLGIVVIYGAVTLVKRSRHNKINNGQEPGLPITEPWEKPTHSSSRPSFRMPMNDPKAQAAKYERRAA